MDGLAIYVHQGCSNWKPAVNQGKCLGGTMTRLRPTLICLALSAAALSGCSSAGLPLIFNGKTELAVLDGRDTVHAPDGYCVASRASRPADGFVVIAPCNVLARTGLTPTIPGLITVQVGPDGSAAVTGNEDALAELLAQDEGRALLAVDGNPATIVVTVSEAYEGHVEVFFSDGTPSFILGLQPDEWRAFLDRGGRMVTIAVRGYQYRPITPSEGLALLRLALSAL